MNIPLFGPGPGADSEGRCLPTPSASHFCDEKGFNITGYGCVQVEAYEQKKVQLLWAKTPVPDPTEGPPNKPWCTAGEHPSNCEPCINDKMLPVTVGCDPDTGISLCETECGYTTGGGDPGTGIKAVSLITLTPVP
mgnify:CR=1 FL=1